ncbi:MAG: hypothetical protein IJL11_00800 [Synergistaceae bacterium]|nr:hypothetical protein [Synergistaceae bacterium]
MIFSMRLHPFYQTNGGASGIKRGGGAETPKATASGAQTTEVTSTVLNLSNSDGISQLKEMAKRGEVPQGIEAGSREANERFYEEFDRLYPNPPGILNDYTVTPQGSRTVDVVFNYNMAEAESPYTVTLPSRNASESARRGAIKHAIYKKRPAVELALSSRSNGFSNFDMADKWGNRVLNNSEKAQVNREMEANIQRLLGTPMSKRGRELNESFWVKSGEGWTRAK